MYYNNMTTVHQDHIKLDHMIYHIKSFFIKTTSNWLIAGFEFYRISFRFFVNKFFIKSEPDYIHGDESTGLTTDLCWI